MTAAIGFTGKTFSSEVAKIAGSPETRIIEIIGDLRQCLGATVVLPIIEKEPDS